MSRISEDHKLQRFCLERFVAFFPRPDHEFESDSVVRLKTFEAAYSSSPQKTTGNNAIYILLPDLSEGMEKSLEVARIHLCVKSTTTRSLWSKESLPSLALPLFQAVWRYKSSPSFSRHQVCPT